MKGELERVEKGELMLSLLWIKEASGVLSRLGRCVAICCCRSDLGGVCSEIDQRWEEDRLCWLLSCLASGVESAVSIVVDFNLKKRRVYAQNAVIALPDIDICGTSELFLESRLSVLGK